MKKLVINNISKTYSKKVNALNEVSLTFESGIYGIIGPNGSGKSTLFNCILGLSKADSGTIDFSPKHLKLSASIYNDGFLNNLSGKQNLEIIQLANNVSDSYLEKIVDQLAIKPYYKRHFKGYSLGMKQKISLAAALLNSPDILILDEPLNGLDVAAKQQIANLILAEKNRGTIILIASHTLAELEKICTHIIFINNGIIRYNVTKEVALNKFQTLENAYNLMIKECV